MLEKIEKHIAENFPFLKDKKLLIAISGGIDSVVLVHLLHQLNFDISLAHCNFKLREKESDLDEEFVLKLAQKTSNQIFTIKFDTEKFAKENKQSTQIAARNLRYNWFKELIKKHNFDFVLTAHHADDNLETFLINLTRGSGLDGFTGIPAVNGNIIRPLLVFSREEIIAFAKENNIDWREDASNASIKYIRNKIRHKIVPVLKEINPNLLETFSKTLENLQESKQIIKDKIEEVSKEIVSKNFSKEFILSEDERLEVTKIDIQKLQKLSNPKAYLYQLLKASNFTEWNDIHNLLFAQSGKQIFSKTHTILKDREFLILSKNLPSSSVEKFLIDKNTSEIKHPIHLKFQNVEEKSTENRQTIYVNKEQLKFPLILRKWQHGDFFYPAGMQGKKKLSKYFKDEKLSLLEKEQTWLLCNSNSEIIWIVGKRQDNRYLIKETSEKIIRISTK